MSKNYKNDIDEIMMEDVDIDDIEDFIPNNKEIAKEDTLEKPEESEKEDTEKKSEEAVEVTEPKVEATTEEKAETAEADDEEDDANGRDVPVKKKRGKGDFLRYTVMFVALCVLVYSVFSLVTIYLEYKAAEDEYADLGIFAQATENPNQATPIPQYMDEQYPLNPDYQIKTIDWASLTAENSDSCAWIQFETLQEEINYPIVHGSDNEYYLNHTISHAENSAGTLFVEALNKSDFTDMNTFVYGHNMKNGSMFGLLRYYKDASYYAGNEYFWIYTPQANYRYKIFSCYEPKATSETYTWWSDPCEEYTEYLKKVQSYSKYDTGVTVKPTDHIVTLSTCTSRGSDYRFVVHAKLVYSSINQ